MKLYESKNKILEIWATARVIVQKYGHRKKFAKHIVAFVIKQMKHFTDEELADFLLVDKIGKILGYKKRPHASVFSKVRKRSDPKIFEDMYNWFLKEKYVGRQIKIRVEKDKAFVQDLRTNMIFLTTADVAKRINIILNKTFEEASRSDPDILKLFEYRKSA
ncbi:MAG: hypothetical protein ACP5M9_02435 [Candidatus Micrarchaeia archaeon]